ncbi:MAG TPA: type II secretion system protein GspM [Rubrivivax sp.]
MTDTTLNAATAPSGAIARQAAKARSWWSALPLRERRLIGVAAAVLGVFVLWLLAVQPALRTLREAPAQIDQLDGQLQSMQRLATEARELRAAPPLAAAQSLLALKAASDRLGDKARLSVQGERAVLTLNGVGSEALRNWLSEVRSGARARPIEAQLSRGPLGFSGTLILATGGTP